MAIYFIQCGTNGPIKIGCTGNSVEERLKQLQTGCPYELRLLWVYTGKEYTEQQFHERFSHERVRGEWFHPSSNIIRFIERELYNNLEIELPNHSGEVVCVAESFDSSKIGNVLLSIATPVAEIYLNEFEKKIEVNPYEREENEYNIINLGVSK